MPVNTAFICMGSNMGNSLALLNQSIDLINAAHGIEVTDISPIYMTEPQGLHDQPWFSNQVLRLSCTTKWHAKTLLTFLHDIEQQLGRVRSTQKDMRYGPRCIDLDLLLFGTENLTDPTCTIPHPRMIKRAFVLIPLRDVCRQDILPFELEHCLKMLNYKVEGQRIYQND